MKIEKICIKNYRSLRDIELYSKDILALVGRNNSGKSNIIKALELFFESSITLVSEECFYEKNLDEPIIIKITFTELTEWEREQFKPWLSENKLTIGRKIKCVGPDSYNIENLAFVESPCVEWLQQSEINGKNINKWWKDRDNLTIGELDFGERLGTSKPLVRDWKEIAKDFVKEYRDKISFKIDILKNPKGYSGVLKGALPHFIHVPAVKEVTEQAKITKTSPFGILVHSIFEKISEEDRDLIAEKIEEINSYINPSAEDKRLDAITRIEKRVNELMSQLMECDIEIFMPLPQLRDIFSNVAIYANDGIRTTIEAKGHGMQRAMILTILRAYSEIVQRKKVKDSTNRSSTIFAIEEPELYLHPQAQRTMMNVIREISEGIDQVIYSTQSSVFVDIQNFDEICIIRREKIEDNNYESIPKQLFVSNLLEDLKARKGVEGTEKGIKEQYYNAFNPMINEGFFADKVVIVEGPSELYSLPIYAKACGYDFDKNNVSIVHSDGKGQMDRILRIFNGFGIPTFLMFDGDKDNNEKAITDKTIELLELLGNPIESIVDLETKIETNYMVIDTKLENCLKDEIDEYEEYVKKAKETMGPVGKPLIHKFIATIIKGEIEGGQPLKIIPTPIFKAFEKIKNLTFTGSILQIV